eukprot:10584016-Ditylum_brightwellii.AAC.1
MTDFKFNMCLSIPVWKHLLSSATQKLEFLSYHFAALKLNSCNSKKKVPLGFIFRNYSGGCAIKMDHTWEEQWQRLLLNCIGVAKVKDLGLVVQCRPNAFVSGGGGGIDGSDLNKPVSIMVAGCHSDLGQT